MTVEERVFNYRLSRAPRVVQNAFGLLAARFRCLLTTVPQNPDRVSTIVLACCVLHSILMIKNPTMDVNAVDQENVTAGVSSGEDAAAAAACRFTLARLPRHDRCLQVSK